MPTLPHRHDQMCELLAELHRQWQPGLGVLVYRDNLRRPGNASYAEWEDLQEMSQAEYTSFISDDDWVAPDFVSRVMQRWKAAPTTWGSRSGTPSTGNAPQTPVEHSLHYDGGHHPPGLLRPRHRALQPDPPRPGPAGHVADRPPGRRPHPGN